MSQAAEPEDVGSVLRQRGLESCAAAQRRKNTKRASRAVHSAPHNVADIGHALEARILRPKRCLPVARTGQNDAVRHGQPDVGLDCRTPDDMNRAPKRNRDIGLTSSRGGFESR